MMPTINNSIFVLGIIFFLNSYKKIEIKKNILLYVLLNLVSIVIDFYFFDNKLYNDLIRLISYFALMKLIVREKVNIIDIFYLQLELLIYYIFKKIIITNVYPEIFILVISIISLLNKKKLIKINNNLIIVWDKPEKGLTCRNICIISFNISIYVIHTFL